MTFITSFELPEHSHLRFWKFRFLNGSWKDVKNRIKTRNGMKLLLRRFDPVEVYYSACLFRNGEFLSAPDIVFDIDNRNIGFARKYAIILFKWMKTDGFNLKQIHFTGSKGFRLIFEDPISNSSITEASRYSNFILRRRALLKRVPKSTSLDKQISIDYKRVIRMVGSYNLKSGKKCVKINLKALYNPDELQAMTREVNSLTINTGVNKAGLAFTPPYSYHTVSNRINGVRDSFVTLIIRRQKSLYRRSIIDVIKKHNLGLLLRFDSDDLYYYVGLKPVSFDKCVKILKYSESLNLKKFVSDKQVFWRITPFKNGSNTFNHVKYAKMINISDIMNVSKPHIIILKNFFNITLADIQLPKNARLIGKPNSIAIIGVTE
jgi:hypothetical protein